MRRVLLVISTLALSGCIQIYGPVKEANSSEGSSASPELPASTETPDSPGSSKSADVGSSMKVGNRKPDELFDKSLAFFTAKGLNASIRESEAGVIAATGSDESLASTWLDCSAVEQTQNIQQSYRVVAQIWSAGEGSNVSVQVNGLAGLTTPDGNDKIKPVECKSRGIFEKDLLEALRK